MLSELALKEPVAERKGNSDQLAVMPETPSRKTRTGLSEMFEEILVWQMRKCTN